ncbi:hypothetical protein BYT27DRAFT_7262718 [Phlegmacium glaucopus]|nr:hypothetical protein BYT27DRAFT_7262718 [Phlegmacium glaucopus]
MFPNVENVTLCNQHEQRLAWIGLQERVLSWLRGIHDPEPCPMSSIRRGSKDRKRHHYSPYPTRCELPHAPSPVLSHKTQLESTLEPEFLVSASEPSPIWDVQENFDRVEYRTTSLIQFKVADDLPDPEYNPLITFFATDIEQEYCRLLFLCSKLEADKLEADLRWKRDMSHAAMRELLDIEISIRRVLQSAQYVIDYSHNCNLNLDFQTLFLQHYRSPFQHLSPEKPIHEMQYFDESWAYSGEAPQYPSQYIPDVREQEVSGFDCQAFTSLNPDARV